MTTKKLLLAGLGVAGACSACCAAPLLVAALSVLLGVSAAGLAGLGHYLFAGGGATTALGAGAAAGGVAAVATWVVRRRNAARSCASGQQQREASAPTPSAPSCGCPGACGVSVRTR